MPTGTVGELQLRSTTMAAIISTRHEKSWWHVDRLDDMQCHAVGLGVEWTRRSRLGLLCNLGLVKVVR